MLVLTHPDRSLTSFCGRLFAGFYGSSFTVGIGLQFLMISVTGFLAYLVYHFITVYADNLSFYLPTCCSLFFDRFQHQVYSVCRIHLSGYIVLHLKTFSSVVELGCCMPALQLIVTEPSIKPLVVTTSVPFQ